MEKAVLVEAYDTLIASRLASVQDLENLILKWDQLNAQVAEAYSRISVSANADTQDPVAKAAFQKMASEIMPLVQQYGASLGQKLADHPKLSEMPASYALYLRKLKKELALFREANLKLKVEDSLYANEYGSITGALQTEFQGKTVTPQQLGKYLEDSDRSVREGAFRAKSKMALEAAPKLDELFGKMLKVRHQIALNAGFQNFRDYKFQDLKRFDYTPEDCFKFHDAIETLVVPLMTELNQQRKSDLGIALVKPWDVLVSTGAKIPVPFETSDELIQKCLNVFRKVDPEIGSFFQDMIDRKLLDIPARAGKAGGGFCTRFPVEKVPFIFMNAAGSKRDVETLLHEGGHAFHYYYSRDIPLMANQHPGSEFAEVASMSMELLARPFLDEFYPQAVIADVLKDQLVSALKLFPFMAMIDSFQHWVYTAGPDGGVILDPAAWKAKWIGLNKQYQPSVDWSGEEAAEAIGWQYLHVFKVPFYYVEYGIAQIGAFAVWAKSLSDYPKAVSDYKDGLKLGATKTLPELLTTVGGKFGLDRETLKPILEQVRCNIGLQGE